VTSNNLEAGSDDDDEVENANQEIDLDPNHLPKDPKRLRGTILENLRQMLEDATPKGFDKIVNWLPSGKAFKVHDTVAFQKSVCGNYFNTSLLRSFSDSLRTWGFCRLWEATGEEKNAYYHRLFQKDKPHLCRHYSRAQMMYAMKDFREEQKRQKEISWSLFPRHREELQNPQQAQQANNMGNRENDLTDAEDSGDEGEPLGMDASVIPNPPEAQDYLIPYLEIPNSNNRERTAVGMDNSLRPSLNETYDMDSCYPKNDTKHKIEDKSERQTGLSYAIRICNMLEDVEQKGKQDIISWKPHGRAFQIHNEAVFESEILPLYFSATSLASFHRWLNKWGFQRIRAGKDRRSWYHRFFVRGIMDLLEGYTQREMSAAMDEWRAPGKEPDFYLSGSGSELSELSSASNKKPKTDVSVDQNADKSQRLDISQNEESSPQELQQLQPQKDPKFLRGTLVEKLREMLDVVKAEGNEDIVSWLPHGKAFKIHNPKAFRESVLHRFFGVSKYRYFGDVLRSWGFVIFKSGKDKGAFYHRCFRRDKPRLCLHLSRSQLKASMKDWPKGAAPDLYQQDADSLDLPTTQGGRNKKKDLGLLEASIGEGMATQTV